MTPKYTARTLKDKVTPWNVKEKDLQAEGEIAQIHNLYLITGTDQGMLFVDQHAAHERILYEQFLQAFKREILQQEIYRLPQSIILDLPVTDISLVEDNIEALNKLGFEIESFGQNTFKVNGVPSIFQERDVSALIGEVLEDLSQEAPTVKIDVLTQRTIAYLACRSAIKAGDPLTPQERRELLEKLKQTTTQYTCPHGRPVMVEVSFRELHKMFKRV